MLNDSEDPNVFPPISLYSRKDSLCISSTSFLIYITSHQILQPYIVIFMINFTSILAYGLSAVHLIVGLLRAGHISGYTLDVLY